MSGRYGGPRRSTQVHLLVRPISPALDRDFKDGAIWVSGIPDGFQFGEASPPDLWSSRHRIVDVAVRQKSLLAVRPTLTFVLRPSAEERGGNLFPPEGVGSQLHLPRFRRSFFFKFVLSMACPLR